MPYYFILCASFKIDPYSIYIYIIIYVIYYEIECNLGHGVQGSRPATRKCLNNFGVKPGDHIGHAMP